MRVGHLELMEFAGKVETPNGTQVPMARFICDCGTEKVINYYNVKSGKVRSCGCLLKASRKKHGMCGTTTYQRWEDMKQRCRPNFKRADRYHDRGIGHPPEWAKFEAFFADMGVCPDGFELDRIDNDEGYSKDNCRWADRSMNMRNRTLTHRKGPGSVQNVRWNEERQHWQAYVKHEGKIKHLGSHATEEEGRQAYNAFAKQHGYPLR